MKGPGRMISIGSMLEPSGRFWLRSAPNVRKKKAHWLRHWQWSGAATHISWLFFTAVRCRSTDKSFTWSESVEHHQKRRPPAQREWEREKIITTIKGEETLKTATFRTHLWNQRNIRSRYKLHKKIPTNQALALVLQGRERHFIAVVL